MLAILEMPRWATSIPGMLEFIVLLGAAVGGFIALKKYVYAPIKKHFKTVDAGMTTLLGYAEVRDPGSGRVIQQATPPLAARVYDLEKTNKDIADALKTLVDIQQNVMKLQEQWAKREEMGTQIIAEWTTWRDMHEKEASQREERILEWEAWRHEQDILMEALKNSHLPPHNQ